MSCGCQSREPPHEVQHRPLPFRDRPQSVRPCFCGAVSVDVEDACQNARQVPALQSPGSIVGRAYECLCRSILPLEENPAECTIRCPTPRRLAIGKDYGESTTCQ